MSQKPGIGRTVHYVSYGTPGGEYPSTCRAAIVTAFDTNQEGKCGGGHHVCHVSLCVLNPEGMFFNRACRFEHPDNGPNGKPEGGTWHWIEDCTD